MSIRVDAFLSVALMNWCHVIRAQGGCITYEHDDADDDTYIHTYSFNTWKMTFAEVTDSPVHQLRSYGANL